MYISLLTGLLVSFNINTSTNTNTNTNTNAYHPYLIYRAPYVHLTTTPANPPRSTSVDALSVQTFGTFRHFSASYDDTSGEIRRRWLILSFSTYLRTLCLFLHSVDGEVDKIRNHAMGFCPFLLNFTFLNCIQMTSMKTLTGPDGTTGMAVLSHRPRAWAAEITTASSSSSPLLSS